MFLKKPLFVFVAFIGIVWFLGDSDVLANIAPQGGGYPNLAGSYGMPQQMGPHANQGYNPYMAQLNSYNQYHHAQAQHAQNAHHAQQPQPQAPYGYNMQQSPYAQQYMANPMQQWGQSYGNPYMNNLSQYGNQMPQVPQSAYPYHSYMPQGTVGGGVVQPGGAFGSIANLLADFGKPQANKSQVSN